MIKAKTCGTDGVAKINSRCQQMTMMMMIIAMKNMKTMKPLRKAPIEELWAETDSHYEEFN